MKSEKKRQKAIVEASAPSAQARGRFAEERAAVWLAGQGVEIIARNLRCRGGEIDLIGLERGALLFVEVRLRASGNYGGAAASITAAKRRRVILAARGWLAGAGRAYRNHPCRFDAVLFDGAETVTPQWIRGAFECD
ncbi:MAG: YraN family protein [Azoarcus sp.]|nr:YraN family protein [Azoarcus sp.]